MQIDRRNLKEHYAQIRQNIQQADFVAFDCEFSGLVTNLEKIQGSFPDHRQFYERTKETALNFKILELGLTTFCYSPHKKHYETMAYNFYILPYVNTAEFNNVLVSEIESLEFLAYHGIDFNRVFKHGIIPQRLIKPFNYQKHRYNARFVNNFKDVYFCPEDQKEIDQIQSRLEKIASQKQGKLEKVDFLNNTFLQYLQNLYECRLTLKKDKKTTGKFEYMVKVLSAENSKKGEGDIIFEKGVEKDEQKQAALKKEQQQKCSVEGILEVIIKKKIPIVGHFPSLDLALIYHTYLEDLPETFEEFSKRLTDAFPHIYDTKILSRRFQHFFKGVKVGLKDLYSACFNPKILEPYCNFNAQGMQKQLRENNSHEAGYDSFMTGCAFLGMTNFLSKNDKPSQISFKNLEMNNEHNVIYSRDAGQMYLREPYSQNSITFERKIVILKEPKTEQNKHKWSAIAEKLSKYGSLSVFEDHGETYFVFQKEIDHLGYVIDDLKEPKLTNYRNRKICRARNMYDSGEQKYIN